MSSCKYGYQSPFGPIRGNFYREEDAPPEANFVLRVVDRDDPQPRGLFYDEEKERIVAVVHEDPPQLIEVDLVKVEPLKTPSSLIFYLQNQYDVKPKEAEDEK